MLRYGNTVRHIPNFHRAARARLAIDANHTSSLPHGETAVSHPDLKLSEALTQTIQWFAEALAAGQGDIHMFTGAWWGNGESVVDMRGP